jgi:hypothetical protein
MSKLVKCKSCGHEIAKSAKVCPSCGQKQGLSFIAKLFLYPILFIGVIALLKDIGTGVSGGDGNSSSTTASSTQQIKVGEVFQTKKLGIKIDDVASVPAVGNGFLNTQASEGAVYIAVAWSYKNISNKPISGFRMPELYLKSADGTKYNRDIAASSALAGQLEINTKVLSDLNPGIQVRDATVFEVSKELFNPQTWKLVIDADMDAEVSL